MIGGYNYKDYQFDLTLLFNRYGYTAPARFELDILYYMEGVGRVANEAHPTVTQRLQKVGTGN